MKIGNTIKHFCCNNQEAGRSTSDSVVSERALREIYLKGFEIAVKEGGARSVMTSYGAVNGLWTSGNEGLCTGILRDEWGFRGIVMTDWGRKPIIREKMLPQKQRRLCSLRRMTSICAFHARLKTRSTTMWRRCLRRGN